MVKIRKAVILAAGLGTRLKPLTDELPKCLMENTAVCICANEDIA